MLLFLLLAGVIGGARPLSAQLLGGLNATLTASPSTTAPGQAVSFSYSATPPAVAPPFAAITSVVINYGDGATGVGTPSGPGQTSSGVLTHVYSLPGSYTATLTATASNGATGSAKAVVTVAGGGTGPGPVAGGLNAMLTASPSSVASGQQVTFSYSATPPAVAPPFASITSVVISYGDGATGVGTPSGPGQPSSGVLTHVYSLPGSYTATLTATASNGATGSAIALVTVAGGVSPGPNVIQPPTNVQIVNPPSTGVAGQPVSFSAATAISATPGAVIQSYNWSFGDGGTTVGQIVSHVFSATGLYTVTLTVTDSAGASAQTATAISITSNVPSPAPGVSVTYQPGWNLVAAPTGTTVTGASGPLYTFQPGDTTYRVDSTTQAGFGYWAYFPSIVTVTIPYSGSQVVTKSLQAGQFSMIGNASSSPAVVSGADIVYVYNAATGYQQATTLQPGQGAWALSFAGGNITMTSNGP